MDLYSVENRIAQIEQTLNPIDWIPYISSFSGLTRVVAGSVEMAAGVAFAALKMFQVILTGRGTYSGAMNQGGVYFFHGMANIIRGSIAIYPFWNLSLIAYDSRIGRVNYPREEIMSDVYPIMTAHNLI